MKPVDDWDFETHFGYTGYDFEISFRADLREHYSSINPESVNLDSDNPNIVVNFETNTLEDDEGMCHSPDSETENTSTYLRHLAEIRKHLEDKNLLSIIESYANREGCTDLEKTIISKIDDAFRREWLIYSHVRDEEVFVKPDNKEIGSVKAVITEEIYSELQELIDLFIEMDRTQLTPFLVCLFQDITVLLIPD